MGGYPLQLVTDNVFQWLYDTPMAIFVIDPHQQNYNKLPSDFLIPTAFFLLFQ